MRTNPRDWRIDDVAALCQAFGVACSPPRGGGSHYTVRHVGAATILTIPARRPIKPVYIRALVDMIDTLRGDAP